MLGGSSLFASSPQPQQGGGLFGNASAPTTGSSLFGNTGGGGLFGNQLNNSSNTGNTGGGLFGRATASGGGLFGAATSSPQQPQIGASLFGAAQPQQTGTGLFGSNTAGSSSGTGLFGSTGIGANTNTSTSLFGNVNTSNTNTGFGSAATGTSLFGNTSNTGLFGNTQSSGLFGNRTTNNAATEQRGTAGINYDPPYVEASNALVLAISYLPPVNQSKSLDELRYEDYQLGNWPKLQGTGLGGGFGSLGTGSPGGGLFGAQNNATSGGLFGASSGGLLGNAAKPTGGGLFGSPTTGATGGGLFGSTNQTNSATGAGLFGQTGTQATGGGLFGSTNTSTLGANTNSTNTVGGLFGSTNNATGGSLFGSTQTNTGTGGGLFGANTIQNQGGTSSGGLFGNTNPTATTGGGIFGNAATSTSSPQAGGSLFGNLGTTAQKPAGSGLFGSTTTGTTGSLFGNTSAQTTQPAATGSSLFGNTANKDGGIFGTNKPATTGNSLFGGTGTGATATGSSLFGTGTTTTGAGTTGIFGNSSLASQPGTLFGSTNATTGTSIFASSLSKPAAAPTTNIFGATQPAQNNSLLGNLGTTAQQNSSFLNPQIQSQLGAMPILVINADPYGFNKLAATASLTQLTNSATIPNPFAFPAPGLIRPSQFKKFKTATYSQLLRPLPEMSGDFRRKAIALPSLTPAAARRLRRAAQSQGLTRAENDTLEESAYYCSPNVASSKSYLRGTGSTESPPPPSKKAWTPFRVPSHSTEMERRTDRGGFSRPSGGYSSGLRRPGSPSTSVGRSGMEDYSGEAPRWLHTAGRKRQGPREAPDENTSIRDISHPPEDFRRPIHPISTLEGYETRPSRETLMASGEARLACIEDFTVRREGYGEIMWPGITDIRGLNLDAAVRIEKREVEVYPDSYVAETGLEIPPEGVGLNKSAVVTLYNCRPSNRTESFDPNDEEYHTYVRRMRRYTDALGAQFLSASPDGVWKFRVSHFSRYGLPTSVSDEEDGNLTMRSVGRPQNPGAAETVGSSSAEVVGPSLEQLNDNSDTAFFGKSRGRVVVSTVNEHSPPKNEAPTLFASNKNSRNSKNALISDPHARIITDLDRQLNVKKQRVGVPENIASPASTASAKALLTSKQFPPADVSSKSIVGPSSLLNRTSVENLPEWVTFVEPVLLLLVDQLLTKERIPDATTQYRLDGGEGLQVYVPQIFSRLLFTWLEQMEDALSTSSENCAITDTAIVLRRWHETFQLMTVLFGVVRFDGEIESGSMGSKRDSVGFQPRTRRRASLTGESLPSAALKIHERFTRLQLLSLWFASCNKKSIQSRLKTLEHDVANSQQSPEEALNTVLELVLLHLFCNDNKAAVQALSFNGAVLQSVASMRKYPSGGYAFPRLALLIAASGRDHSTLQSPHLMEQLQMWQQKRLYESIPLAHLRILHILAGCVDRLVSEKAENWRELLALIYWRSIPDHTAMEAAADLNSEVDGAALVADEDKQRAITPSQVLPRWSLSNLSTLALWHSVSFQLQIQKALNSMSIHLMNNASQALLAYEELLRMDKQDGMKKVPTPCRGACEDLQFSLLKCFAATSNKRFSVLKTFSQDVNTVLEPSELLLRYCVIQFLKLYYQFNELDAEGETTLNRSDEAKNTPSIHSTMKALEEHGLWHISIAVLLHNVFLMNKTLSTELSQARQTLLDSIAAAFPLKRGENVRAYATWKERVYYCVQHLGLPKALFDFHEGSRLFASGCFLEAADQYLDCVVAPEFESDAADVGSAKTLFALANFRLQHFFTPTAALAKAGQAFLYSEECHAGLQDAIGAVIENEQFTSRALDLEFSCWCQSENAQKVRAARQQLLPIGCIAQQILDAEAVTKNCEANLLKATRRATLEICSALLMADQDFFLADRWAHESAVGCIALGCLWLSRVCRIINRALSGAGTKRCAECEEDRLATMGMKTRLQAMLASHLSASRNTTISQEADCGEVPLNLNVSSAVPNCIRLPQHCIPTLLNLEKLLLTCHIATDVRNSTTRASAN